MPDNIVINNAVTGVEIENNSKVLLPVHSKHNHKRNYGLDILRALAILFVLYGHSFRCFDFGYYSYYVLIDGVSVFFVLSGFLIGNILLKTIESKEFSFRVMMDFWLKRWFRTLPAYFFVITIMILLAYWQGYVTSFSNYIKYYFFVQTIVKGDPPFFPESWSLCIEEWFYILMPLFLFLSFKIFKLSKQKIIFFWIILIILFSTVLRILRAAVMGYESIEDWDIFIKQPIFQRLDSIMFGVLGAYLSFYKSKFWRNKELLFWLGIIICIIPPLNRNYFDNIFLRVYLMITLQSIGVLFILPKLVSIKSGKGIVFRLITYISTISYSLYLLNLSPFDQVRNSTRFEILLKHIETFGISYGITQFIFYLLFTFIGAIILYKLVEQPMMKFRDKVLAKRISSA